VKTLPRPEAGKRPQITIICRIFAKYLTKFAVCFNQCAFSQTFKARTMDAQVKPKDKHQRFRALAESRTNKAIQAIVRIGNLSNRQIYDFEEPEVRKIIRALRDAVSAVEGRFESPRGKSGGGFKL
jgi:hypothetical protein